MLKRWAALPRGIQWLVGIAAAVLGLAIVWALFVPVADWLAQHDVGSVKGSLHATAVDNARGRLLTLGAGLFAAGALIFTARNFVLSRRTVELSRRTFGLAEQGQATDHYTKAVEQLGSEKLDIRLGGIYALEGIARDSPERDHPTVMEVLTAFIRGHSHEQWPLPEHDADPALRRETRPDVQAALTVVGRRDAKRDIPNRPIDLTDAILIHVDLTGAKLTGALLIRANLRDADLAAAELVEAGVSEADLGGADLAGAHLEGADLSNADLGGADLAGAHLEGADLSNADLGDVRGLAGGHLDKANLSGAKLRWGILTGAHLEGADLSGAHLEGADLSGAHLEGADLSNADLGGADLSDADLGGVRGLLREQLDAALGNMETKLPDGCRRPAAWST